MENSFQYVRSAAARTHKIKPGMTTSVLNDIRVDRGLTRPALAELAEVNITVLNNLINGSIDPIRRDQTNFGEIRDDVLRILIVLETDFETAFPEYGCSYDGYKLDDEAELTDEQILAITCGLRNHDFVAQIEREDTWKELMLVEESESITEDTINRVAGPRYFPKVFIMHHLLGYNYSEIGTIINRSGKRAHQCVKHDLITYCAGDYGMNNPSPTRKLLSDLDESRRHFNTSAV